MLEKKGNRMIDYSYTELDGDVIKAFEAPYYKGRSPLTLEANYFYAECDDEPDMFMHHLKVVVYEVKHNILTQGMKADFIQYAERWDKGEFQPEIFPEDIPIIQKDIDYVRSVLKL